MANLYKSKMQLGLLEEAVAEAEEEEEVPEAPAEPQPLSPQRRLHRDEAGVRLQMLGKTADGDSYAYLKLVCTGMSLTDISVIAAFEYVMFVNVSNNCLTLDDLQVLTTMPSLILLHADHNRISSPALKRAEYLQVVIMNNNKITSCKEFYQPNASTIELAENDLTQIEFAYDMPDVKCLDLRYNRITNLTGIRFTSIQSLYMAGNKIKTLEGIESLVNLKVLHVRNNPIKKLDGITSSLKKLVYLNLRSCNVASLRQVKKLKVLPALQVLILKGTPYMGGAGTEASEQDTQPDEEDASEQRIEILAAVPKLQRINKTPVSPQDRAEGLELLKMWIEEGAEDEEEEEEKGEEEEKKEDH